MADKLTPRQRRFVDEFVLSGNAADAMRKAGYSNNAANVTGSQLLAKPSIQQALAIAKRRESDKLGLRREHLVAAILEAIALARSQGNASAMISGLREIGRLCGFYEPEVVKTPISKDGAHFLHRLREMSDEELAEIASC